MHELVFDQTFILDEVFAESFLLLFSLILELPQLGLQLIFYGVQLDILCEAVFQLFTEKPLLVLQKILSVKVSFHFLLVPCDLGLQLIVFLQQPLFILPQLCPRILDLFLT